MEITSTYNSGEVANKWYAYWMDNGFLKSKQSESAPESVVISTTSVTDVLHTGHRVHNTV